MSTTAEPRVRRPSKFYLDAMKRLERAPSSYLTDDQRTALRESEMKLDGAVYSGDPQGRYPNTNFDD